MSLNFLKGRDVARRNYSGILYVCSYGVVNCRICKPDDAQEKRKAKAKELREKRAEEFRFRNSPRLIIVQPKVTPPSAPAPAKVRTITQAQIEDAKKWDGEAYWTFSDLLEQSGFKPVEEKTAYAKDRTPSDIIREHSENEWRERTWGKRQA